MDELAWLVVVVLAFPVMALVALVLALRQRSRIALLEARIAALEAQAEAQAGTFLDGPSARPAEDMRPEIPRPSPLPQPASPPRRGPQDGAPPHDVTRPPPILPPPTAPSAGRWNGARLRGGLAGFEEKVGARWAVWVGGIALALGGVFLVRFAVEQELIGPAARIGLGLALAAALLIGGEWLRRLDHRAGDAAARALPTAHVPSVLTAAGTVTAFGSIFAAYELYHLLPPAAAFVLLALTGVATLFAALLHGPALAVLGFVGAAVTPFLITSDTPDAWGVAILIAVVGASALGVARLRLWRWLALLAVAGMAVWGLTLLVFDVPHAVPAAGAMGLALLAFTAAGLTPDLLWGPRQANGVPPAPDLVATVAAAAALAMAVAAAVESGSTAGPLAVFLLACTGALALAWTAEAATLAAAAAALASPLVLHFWVFPPDAGSTLAPAGPMAGVVPEPARLSIGHFMLFGFAVGAVLAGAGFAGALRARRALPALGWAAAGAAGPLLLLIAAYGRLSDLERSLPFAALALGLAFLSTLAAELFNRLARTGPAAIYAAGGVVALGLGLAFALEKGWLTVGLALASLAVAWVSTLRPLPGLRQLAAGLGVVVLGRIGWEPTIAGTDLGATPIVNWLLWGYGVPALAFALGARLLAREADDWSRRTLECLALLFAVLLAAFEVRHLAHGGDVYAAGTRLFEAGLLASAYGAYAVGLTRLATVTGRGLYRLFADGVAALAALCVLEALVASNPFATGEGVGGPVFNDLLVAYAMPAVLALAFAGGLPPERRRLRLAAGSLALVLALAYLTFETSRLFQGPVLAAGAISSAEWYAYSAVWLAFGIVLLAVGLWRGSRTLRLASAAVTGATVVKVFVSDMADLEGVLRALSFIGLGLVLVAMGWLYQRILLGARQPPPPAAG